MTEGGRTTLGAPSFPDRLVVASYNIHGCVGVDGRLDPERTAETIRSIDAEVIGLQEVGGHAAGRRLLDQLEYLACYLQLTPVAGPTLVRDTGAYGNALLTRLPVIDCRRIDLSVGRGEPRGAIDVDLDVRGKRLRVIATHFGLGWRERRKQRSLVGKIIEEDGGPLVVLGDLNQWWPPGYCRRSSWPGFAPVPCPRTYPSRFPLLSLDRILVRPAEALGALAAVRTPLAARASDHLPVRAVLDIRCARHGQPG
jgi:endonuclease/exonuclease/phosphatase family metal-dependent hydrolase